MTETRARAAFGALIAAAYVALSLASRTLYPFSDFGMYSTERVDSGSRIVAVDAAGLARELDELTELHCDGPIDTQPSACPNDWPYYYVPYLDQRAKDWIAAHAGQGGEPFTITRRIYRFDDDGRVRESDCALQRCSARRR